MKYFVFVSDAKVDMLLPQIPHEMKSKLAAEIGVSVGVLTAKLRSEQDIGVKPDRISRLDAVVKFLRKTYAVGTVDNPKAWVEGAEEVKIAYPTANREAVFFVGRSQEQTRFALGGSSGHLTSRGQAKTTDIGWSFLPDLMMQLKSMIGSFEDESVKHKLIESAVPAVTKGLEFEWMDFITVLEKRVPGPLMRVSFLAKRLLDGRHEDLGLGFNVVLATPLYVAMEQ